MRYRPDSSTQHIAVRRGFAMRGRMQRKAGGLFRFALVLCLSVLCRNIHAQTTSPQEKTMKHYALLFHTSRTLTPDEQKQRALDIAAWVRGVTEMGVALDPRSLGDTAANFSAEGGEIVSRHGSGDPTFSNIVFFDCSSRE